MKTETAEKVLIKMVEARNNVKFLWGDKYESQIKKYIDLVSGVAKKEDISNVASMAKIIIENNSDGYLFQAFILTATYELELKEIDK